MSGIIIFKINSNMTIAEKGPIAPVPVIPNAAERTSQAVQSWQGVFSLAHWDLYRPTVVDGADFYVGEEELGHIHLDGEVHIPMGTSLRDLLLENKLARKFRFGDSNEGWVDFSIRNEQDAEHAIWLFQLNYDRLMEVPIEQLVERTQKRVKVVL